MVATSYWYVDICLFKKKIISYDQIIQVWGFSTIMPTCCIIHMFTKSRTSNCCGKLLMERLCSECIHRVSFCLYAVLNPTDLGWL